MFYSIAIDGPAGAGKSTIAKKVAKKLGFIYVDTGAMYRAMALYFIRNGIKADDVPAIEAACENINIEIRYSDGEQQVILNGENVSGLIRTEEVGNMASASSTILKVRSKLLETQRNLADIANVIMDGRDIGTHVLPGAFVKIYLTAAAEERARRRCLELEQKGQKCDYEKVLSDIQTRDERDMNREHAPLRKAEGAVLVDSSDMTIDEVAAEIEKIYLRQLKESGVSAV